MRMPISTWLRSRALAGLLDQLAFSLQNFAIVFVALHALGLAELGEFTLTATLMILAQTSARSLVLEPLTIRFSVGAATDHRAAVGKAAGLSAAIGVGVLLLCGGAGLAIGDYILAAAGVTLLFLLVQDAWRFGLFSAHRTWQTAINDGTCLVITLAGLSLAETTHHLDGPVILLMWGLGALAGCLLGCLQLTTLPRVFRAVAWLSEEWRIGVPLMGSTLAQQMAGRMSLVIVAAVAGQAALGLISAARTVLTPLSTVIVATFSFGVPEAVRRLNRQAGDDRAAAVGALASYTFVLSSALVVAGVVLTGVLYVLPDSIGHLIAGDNWSNAKQLLLPTALWILGTAASQGPRIGLRALQQPNTILRIALWLGPALLGATTVGTFTHGAAGAAWGFGIASILGQLPWTLAYRRARKTWQLASDASETPVS